MRNLRIAHIADTHLGYRASAVPGRDEDFARSWLAACRAIVDSKPDLILHAGDIFHSTHPSWGALARFLEGAYILRQAKCPVLMIIGNHDFSRLRLQHTVFSVLQEMLPDFVIADGFNPVSIPYHQLETEITLLPHPALLNPMLSKRLIETTTSLNERWTNILVAHGDVRENTRGENIEHGSVAIPKHVFDYDWAYVALGHLHMAQPFGPKGWYSGSIERCGWSDYPADPAWTLVEISAKGLRHTQRPLIHRTMRQLPTFYCEDASDFEIQDEVVRRIENEKLPEERSIVRIVLDDVSANRARHLERIIRTNLKQLYPNLSVQVATKDVAKPQEIEIREHRVDKKFSVEEMFQEFIAGRTYPPEDPGLKDRILTKGLTALRQARESAAAADLGDERSVPA